MDVDPQVSKGAALGPKFAALLEFVKTWRQTARSPPRS
jgi:hypothetical protein